MSVGCPRCGGSDRIELAVGFFECTSAVVVGEVPPGVAGPAPVTQWGRCGYRYQEAPKVVVPSCHVDGCGMFSVGACVECGRAICGRHLNVVEDRTLCPTDADRVHQELERAKTQLATDHRNRVQGWVRSFTTANTASEVLEAVRDLAPYAAIERYKARTRMEEMGVEPPDEAARRRAWRVLREDVGHTPQLELLKIGGGGFSGKKPVLLGRPTPLWGYPLFYWYKTVDLGELRHESTLVAISAEGNVYANVPNRSGSGGGPAFSTFRCERDPWTNKFGYITRAGDGLRKRSGAQGNAWLVTAAPAPRPVSLRDLAEWASRGDAAANLLFSELEGNDRYASEGVSSTVVRQLSGHDSGSAAGIGDWY